MSYDANATDGPAWVSLEHANVMLSHAERDRRSQAADQQNALRAQATLSTITEKAILSGKGDIRNRLYILLSINSINVSGLV